MPCDDGNLFDGDGCSSTCEIEQNYFCSYDDKKTRDICHYIIPLSANISIPTDVATFSQIQFNHPIVNGNQKILEYISLSVSVNYSSNLIFIANDTIQIYLSYNVSFKSAELIVNLSNLNAFLSFQNQILQTSVLIQQLPNYHHYSYIEEQMQNFSSPVSNSIGSSSSFLSIFSFLPTKFSGYFLNILSSLQFIFYLSLIKIKYPQNFKSILKHSFQPPFNFIPNFISDFGMKNKIFIKIDNIFTKNNFNSIFIINNGSLIIFIGFLLILHLLLIIISKLSKKPKIKFLEYFQIFLSNAPYLILSIIFSIFQFSYSNWFTAISSVICYILFILMIIWIHERHANQDCELVNLKVLYPKFKASKSSFGIIDLLQMTILSTSLILLENMPIINNVLIVVVKLGYISLLIKFQPSENNSLFIFNEVGNLILASITTVLAMDDKYNWVTEDTRFNIGWIAIVCVFVNIFIQLLLGIIQVITKYKSKLQN